MSVGFLGFTFGDLLVIFTAHFSFGSQGFCKVTYVSYLYTPANNSLLNTFLLVYDF